MAAPAAKADVWRTIASGNGVLASEPLMLLMALVPLADSEGVVGRIGDATDSSLDLNRIPAVAALPVELCSGGKPEGRGV